MIYSSNEKDNNSSLGSGNGRSSNGKYPFRSPSSSSSSSSSSPLSNKEKKFYIQNILSTCTVLHRMVLFDVTLSTNVIIGLCNILSFLYCYQCHDCIVVGSTILNTPPGSSHAPGHAFGSRSRSSSISISSGSSRNERLIHVLSSLQKNGASNVDDNPFCTTSTSTRDNDNSGHVKDSFNKGYGQYHHQHGYNHRHRHRHSMRDMNGTCNSRKRPISSFSSRRKFNSKDDEIDNADSDADTDVTNSSSVFSSVQVEDVLAVNCIVLLEQVIGMSLCNTGANTSMTSFSNATSSSSSTRGTTATKTKGRRISTRYNHKSELRPTSLLVSRKQRQLQLLRQQETIGRILSLLNMHLGPELMIPVSTNDMSCMYMNHERNKRNNCTKVATMSSSSPSSSSSSSRIVLRHGLGVGAKMMVRLYMYDIVQKLSFHNTRG